MRYRVLQAKTDTSLSLLATMKAIISSKVMVLEAYFIPCCNASDPDPLEMPTIHK
jgi:hypothetical protein